MANRRLLSYPFTITVTADDHGTFQGAVSLDAFRPLTYGGGYIKAVLVKAPGNEAFDFYIQNPNGLKCFSRKDVVKELADDCETPIPGLLPDDTIGYTAGIENAVISGDYSCEIVFAEVY